jgi:hypothetical protein
VAAGDYRTFAFDVARVISSAKFVGRGPYWKLYAAENLLRVVVHTVLSLQIPGGDWWTQTVAPDVQKEANAAAKRYAARPWHTSPGVHGIYYITLYQLTEIIRTSSHLLTAAVPDVDQWILRLETVRYPRNIVGHMNFPTKTDQKRIDVLYDDVHALATKLVSDGYGLKIP